MGHGMKATVVDSLAALSGPFDQVRERTLFRLGLARGVLRLADPLDLDRLAIDGRRLGSFEVDGKSAGRAWAAGWRPTAIQIYHLLTWADVLNAIEEETGFEVYPTAWGRSDEYNAGLTAKGYAPAANSHHLLRRHAAGLDAVGIGVHPREVVAFLKARGWSGEAIAYSGANGKTPHFHLAFLQ